MRRGLSAYRLSSRGVALNYALTTKRGIDLDDALSVHQRYCTHCLMLVGSIRSIAYLVVYEQVSGGAVRSDNRLHAKPRNTFCACPQPRKRAAYDQKKYTANYILHVSYEGSYSADLVNHDTYSEDSA